MADVLRGTSDAAPVFTEAVGLDEVAEGYRMTDEREAITLLVKP